MKRLKLLSMLLALVLVFGSLLGTTALAATTTTATKVVAEAQADEADAQAAAEEGTQKKGLGKQMLILLAFAVGVGILASVYGLTTMRYNQEIVNIIKNDDETCKSISYITDAGRTDIYYDIYRRYISDKEENPEILIEQVLIK